MLLLANAVTGTHRHGIETWCTTSNALEPIAQSHNHRLLCLDEMGQAKDPAVVLDAAYKLAQGVGKSRMSASGKLLESYRFDLMFLSSGEDSFSNTYRSETGKEAFPGQKIRFVDIEWSEDINPYSGDADFSALLESMDTQRGTPGAAFLERLATMTPESKAEIKAQYKSILAGLCRNIGDPKAKRVANRFAVCILAAKLAKRWGILPSSWNYDFGPETIFKRWVKTMASADESMLAAGRLRDLVDAAITGKKLHEYTVEPNGLFLRSQSNYPIGYYDRTNDIIQLFPNMLDKVITINPTSVKRALNEAGILQYNDKRKTYKHRMRTLAAGPRKLADSQTQVININRKALGDYLDA